MHLQYYARQCLQHELKADYWILYNCAYCLANLLTVFVALRVVCSVRTLLCREEHGTCKIVLVSKPIGSFCCPKGCVLCAFPKYTTTQGRTWDIQELCW